MERLITHSISDKKLFECSESFISGFRGDAREKKIDYRSDPKKAIHELKKSFFKSYSDRFYEDLIKGRGGFEIDYLGIPDYQSKFKSLLERLKFDRPVTTKQDGGWFRVLWKIEGASEKKTLGIFKVTHKEYFTIDILGYAHTHSHAVDMSKDQQRMISQNTIKIADSIPKIISKLYDLSLRYKCMIQFKIRDEIEGILEKIDNLVVHYYGSSEISNHELSKLIRSAVEETAGEYIFHRSGRAKTGFDLEFSISGSDETYTHGQVIAILVLIDLFNNSELLDDIFSNIRIHPDENLVKKMAHWLRKKIDKCGSVTMEEAGEIISKEMSEYGILK